MLIEDILNFLEQNHYQCRFSGNKLIDIKGFCALSKPSDNSVTWVKKAINLTAEVEERLRQCSDVLIIAGDEALMSGDHNYIIVQNPKAAYFKVLTHYFKTMSVPTIATDSVVETDRIGAKVSIGHSCHICAEAEIADGVRIADHVSIVSPCRIGENTLIHSGVVIGTDGFGYYQENGINKKVPHFGGVEIGSEVELGANTCIDRGTLGDTVIGDNTKIDDLCLIGHNVKLGKNVLVIGGTVICGSCDIGDNAYIAPKSVIMNQSKIGKGAYVGIGSVVLSDVGEGERVFGNPARQIPGFH